MCFSESSREQEIISYIKFSKHTFFVVTRSYLQFWQWGSEIFFCQITLPNGLLFPVTCSCTSSYCWMSALEWYGKCFYIWYPSQKDDARGWHLILEKNSSSSITLIPWEFKCLIFFVKYEKFFPYLVLDCVIALYLALKKL